MVESKDVIGQCMGDFGKWQLRTILIIFLCKIPTSWFMAVVIYTAPTPLPGEYWCRPPNNFQPNSSKDWMKAVHPWVEGIGDQRAKYDECHVYKDVMDQPEQYKNFLDSSTLPLNRTLVECTNHVFFSDFRSLIAEFNLVCNRSLLLSLSQSFHICGLLCGGILAYMLLKV